LCGALALHVRQGILRTRQDARPNLAGRLCLLRSVLSLFRNSTPYLTGVLALGSRPVYTVQWHRPR
jgi:hypothetical protein